MEDGFTCSGRKTMNNALDNTSDRISFALDSLYQSREGIRVGFFPHLNELRMNINSFGR